MCRIKGGKDYYLHMKERLIQILPTLPVGSERTLDAILAVLRCDRCESWQFGMFNRCTNAFGLKNPGASEHCCHWTAR